MKSNIRRYKPSDEKAFFELCLSQWYERNTYNIFEYPGLDPWTWIDHKLYNNDYIVLVDDSLQGFICGHRDENSMEVEHLYVSPSKRREGLAFALKRKLEEVAKQEGCSLIYTYNKIDNDNSRKLNIKAGWKIEPYNNEYYRSSKKL